jgi:membrane-associated PAP2 superfamily phosphatase
VTAAGRPAAWLLGGAGAALLLPWRSIDLAAARFFYRPEIPAGPWQPAELPWRLLAGVTPVLAVGLACFGLALLLREVSLRPGLLVLLGLLLGPGLLVNAIGKDHWHRPRPRQTEGLGGDFAYIVPLHVGPAGKSFPCGHASVGFACAAVGLALRARRPRAARRWVLGSLVLGLFLGIGRVATGAHFVSDVVWAGVFTYAALLVTAVIVRPGRAHDTRSRRLPVSRAARLAATAGALVLAGVVAAFFVPFRRDLAPEPIAGDIAAGAPWRLHIDVEVGHARIILDPGRALLREAHYDGFGLPGGRLDEATWVDAPGHALGIRLRPRGRFADLEGVATYRVPPALVEALEVDVKDGMLTIENEAGIAPLPGIDCRIRPGALRLRGAVRPDQVRMLPPR